jgi:hypothetical protein
VCGSNVFEIVNVVNSDVHLVLDNKVKEFVGILFKLLPGCNVVEERWAEYLGILRSEPSFNAVSAIQISTTTTISW